MRKIIFVAVAVLFSWNIVSAQIPQIERDALIAFYNSTNGATWSNSTNWLGATGTECTWYGVGCSDGHVSSLFLYSNGLTGFLPPEIGNLTSITNLTLSSNQLAGSIPPQLGTLINLRDLRLDMNDLTGSIPSQLGDLTSLTMLMLASNELSGVIPPQVGDLSNLLNLSLGRNQLTGSIPPALGDLVSLQHLYLNDNQLTGSIPPELGDLPNLIYLLLNNNQLTGGIPPALEDLSNLQYLHLNSNPLGGSIPPELGNLSGLLDLRLYVNQLTGNIPPQLGGMASLMSLDLNSNRLSGSIPPELEDLSSLQTLRLERNLLGGAIPSEIGSLSNLQYLFLNDNPLEGTIPPELGDLSSLEYLHLNGTQLSGSIPTELMDLSTLHDGNGLDLRFNALHSDVTALIAFLNQKQISGDWQSYQTIAPENVIVEWVGDHTMWLSWDAVSFQSYPGGYEAFVSPAATGQWVSAGKAGSKSELEMPITGLDEGASYDFAVASYTLPNGFNPNTVTSDLGEPVMSTTAATGCAAPGMEISWGYPTTLSLTMNFDSYAWSTGETSPAIAVDPSVTRFYWVTVASSGPCQESAMVLVDQVVFSDDFDSGDDGAWSNAGP